MNELHYQLDLLKAMNQKLSNKERMYRQVCDAADCAFLYYSFDKNEVIVLGKWKEFFDFDILEIKDMARLYDIVEENYVLSLREALFPEKSGEESSVIECRRSDKKVWFRFRASVAYGDDGQPLEKIITITNITKYQLQNEELTYFAYYDSITGLYNRNYFVRLLGEYVREAAENNDIVSVMMIDIDDFHKINDGLGMVIGDEVVQQFGFFLKEFMEEKMLVCHLDSDVYCIAIYNPSGTRSVEHLHKAIQKRTKASFRLSSGQDIYLTVSIGVAEYPEAAATALELINCAEIVMYKCKALGKNSIQYYDNPTLNEFLRSVEIENKLKEAVSHKHFELYYQPQYYTGNKRLRGFEALIRWRDEGERMISPSVFIPIAEKNGAIIPIGSWVVEESVKQYASWRNQFGIRLVLAINISAKQYQKDDFVESFLNVLQKYNVDPCEVELEVTESILIDDFEAVSAKLQILKEHGIRISLDDFGTGFSSLSYLKKLPINTLKIDKSFVDTVLTDSATRIITESIVDMVKALGFESVAEGVEEEQQYEYLHAIGCDVTQGFLLGKPQSAEDIEKLLQKLL